MFSFSVLYTHTHTHTHTHKFVYLFLAVLGLWRCTLAFLSVVSRGYSSLRCAGFSRCWLLLLQSTASRVLRLQQWQLLGHVAHAKSSWCMGLVAPQHVASSKPRDQTHVSCIGRRILYHWAIREVLSYFFSTWVFRCCVVERESMYLRICVVRDFLCGPVTKTPSPQGRGPGFGSWSGN